MTLGAGTLLALFWLVRHLADVLVPFAVAVLLAYLINPMVTALEGRLRNRTAATLITVSGCLVVLAALVVIAIPIVAGEVADFGQVLRNLQADSSGPWTLRERYDALVENQSSQTVQRILAAVREAVAKADVQALVVNAARRVAPWLWDLAGGALAFVWGLTGLVVVVLYVVFVSIDYVRLSAAWKTYLPPQYRERLVGFTTEFSSAMSRYFRAQFMIAAAMGVLYAIGFSIIGLRMGVVLGLLVGLLNMVPYLQTVGFVPALVLAVLRAVEGGSSLMLSVFWVVVVFVLAQAAQEVILIPRIMGRQTGLRPVVLMLSVFVWGKLLGFLGLLLAIPLTCVGIAVYRRWILRLPDRAQAPDAKADT